MVENGEKNKNISKKCVFREFLKMLNGGPGPGPAAGTVFRSKLESQHIEFIVLK